MFNDKETRAFNEAEIEMYNFTIQNKHLIPYMTIREFSSKVHSSSPSVLRFCRKVGFSGFTEFKLSCKKELEQVNVSTSSDNVSVLFRDFLSRIDAKDYREKLNQAANMLLKADRVFCIGAGASGSIAYYAAMYFTASGKFASFIDSRFTEAVHKPSDDLYVLFSVSGESENMIDFIRSIRDNNGKSLLITNSSYTTLSKLADFVLPYNIYHSKFVHEGEPETNKMGLVTNLLDNLSTQLPVVYIIETLSKMILNENS